MGDAESSSLLLVLSKDSNHKVPRASLHLDQNVVVRYPISTLVLVQSLKMLSSWYLQAIAIESVVLSVSFPRVGLRSVYSARVVVRLLLLAEHVH